MKKELGKWLMDIAKYLTTAVLLSSVFNDIKDSWIIYFVVSIAIVLTLLSGLWLVREEKKEGDGSNYHVSTCVGYSYCRCDLL